MILDTNALSAWPDGDPALEAVLVEAPSLELNTISLGEYRYGILTSRHRTEYETRLSLIESQTPVLAADLTTVRFYALIRLELKSKGRPIPYHDVWIAALAWQHRLSILSQDAHFDEAGADFPTSSH